MAERVTVSARGIQRAGEDGRGDVGGHRWRRGGSGGGDADDRRRRTDTECVLELSPTTNRGERREDPEVRATLTGPSSESVKVTSMRLRLSPSSEQVSAAGLASVAWATLARGVSDVGNGFVLQ